MENAQFQVYTGNGKGKTTAAVGLTVRASGAGLKVYFGQFIKDMEYSEVEMMRALPGVSVELYGTGKGCLVDKKPSREDYASAAAGLGRLRAAMLSGDYDLVVADEINIACAMGLMSEEALMELIFCRPSRVELVFTGRYAPQRVLDAADLVTEMREIRHYYAGKGLEARLGIEK